MLPVVDRLVAARRRGERRHDAGAVAPGGGRRGARRRQRRVRRPGRRRDVRGRRRDRRRLRGDALARARRRHGRARRLRRRGRRRAPGARRARRRAARRRACATSQVVLDPGLGLREARRQQLAAARAARPSCVGGRLPGAGRREPQAVPRAPARAAPTATPAPPLARDRATAAVSALAAAAGAWCVRVHEVAASADAVRVAAAWQAARVRGRRASRTRRAGAWTRTRGPEGAPVTTHDEAGTRRQRAPARPDPADGIDRDRLPRGLRARAPRRPDVRRRRRGAPRHAPRRRRRRPRAHRCTTACSPSRWPRCSRASPVDLIETVAERIAATVLAFRRSSPSTSPCTSRRRRSPCRSATSSSPSTATGRSCPRPSRTAARRRAVAARSTRRASSPVDAAAHRARRRCYPPSRRRRRAVGGRCPTPSAELAPPVAAHARAVDRPTVVRRAVCGGPARRRADEPVDVGARDRREPRLAAGHAAPGGRRPRRDAGHRGLDVSPLARTAAVGEPDQPDFLNAVVLAQHHALAARPAARRAGHRAPARSGAARALGSADARRRHRRVRLDARRDRGPRAAAPAGARARVRPRAVGAGRPHAVLPGLGGGPVAALAATAPDRDGVRWLALDWLTAPVPGRTTRRGRREHRAGRPGAGRVMRRTRWQTLAAARRRGGAAVTWIVLRVAGRPRRRAAARARGSWRPW